MRFIISLVSIALLALSCARTPPSACKPGEKEIPKAGSLSQREQLMGDIRIVTEEPDPRICDYIDDTMGASLKKDLAEAQSEARLMMKSKGLAMGGNTIRLDTNTVDDPGLIERGQVVLNGRVFKCDLTINPEALLGPVDRTLAAKPREPIPDAKPIENKEDTPSSSTAKSPVSAASGTSSPQSTSASAPPSASTPGKGSTTSQGVNPPADPGNRFDERSFLNAGEREFEG